MSALTPTDVMILADHDDEGQRLAMPADPHGDPLCKPFRGSLAVLKARAWCAMHGFNFFSPVTSSEG